jgi:Tat protein translocase TatB subunit
MFGVGFTEVIAIAVIALIFIGPDDLPRFARQIGRFLNELKRGSDHFVDELKSAADLDSFKNLESDINQSLNDDLSAHSVKESNNDKANKNE